VPTAREWLIVRQGTCHSTPFLVSARPAGPSCTLCSQGLNRATDTDSVGASHCSDVQYTENAVQPAAQCMYHHIVHYSWYPMSCWQFQVYAEGQGERGEGCMPSVV